MTDNEKTLAEQIADMPQEDLRPFRHELYKAAAKRAVVTAVVYVGTKILLAKLDEKLSKDTVTDTDETDS